MYLWKEEEETINHLIWECPIVQRFLEQLHSICISKDIEINLSNDTFIFGQTNKNEFSELFNILLMLIKQYIYKARCQNTCLSIKGFLNISVLTLKPWNTMLMTVHISIVLIRSGRNGLLNFNLMTFFIGSFNYYIL